jgi:hypothetical protein
MATRHFLLCIGFSAMAGLTGCQSSSPVSMVDALPPPTFNGPTFDETPVVPTPPAAPVIPYTHRQTEIRPEPGIPASWIPIAKPNHWKWIVIHHSATATGDAAVFDKMHRAKGWDELGYHFVIGNGTGSGDGQIEVGPRWPKQKWGAHDKTPGNQFNEHGIGICLVGNFDVTHPTAAQIKSLERLVSYLMKTYRIPADHVLGHGETKATDCPGRYMNVAAVRRTCARMLADGRPQAQTREPVPGQELLADTRGK